MKNIILPILLFFLAGCTGELKKENAEPRGQIEKLDTAKRALEVDGALKASEITTLRRQVEMLTKENENLQRRVIDLTEEKLRNQKGEIVGSVTYYFNKNYGYKPDVGAEIYIWKGDDSSMIGAEKIDAYLKRAGLKDAAEWKVFQSEVSDGIRNMEFAASTIKLKADGAGSFRQKLPIGKYNILIRSANRDGGNSVDQMGQIDFKTVDLKADEQSSVSARFLP